MTAKLIALVLPLGLDTFAVAAAIGMIGVSSAADGESRCCSPVSKRECR
jgi:hypothetical protein